MSTPVIYNGTSYNVPAYQDTGYAQGAGNLSSYLIALATGSLTLAGGTFTLTADANFGANFGLKSLYYKSRNANVAATGIIRLGSAEMICWRDNANANDLELTTNASDQLTFNGLVIATSTGALNGTTLTLTATSNQMVIGTGFTTTVSFTAPAASRVYTVPDVLGAADFVLTLGTQTIGGVKTFSSGVKINPTTNQLILGVTNTTTISATAPASSAVYTIPDVGTAADFILTTGTQTITGVKTFASSALKLQEVGSTDVVTVAVAALAASRIYTVPDAGAAASFVMTEGAQTINGTKTMSALIATLAGNMPAATFKLTGLGAGTAAGDSLRFEQMKVVQYQSGTKTSAFTTTNVAFQASGLSCSITPTSSSNKVLVIVSAALSIVTAAQINFATIARGGTNLGGSNGLSNVSVNAANAGCAGAMMFLDSPATTSATTYEAYIRTSGGASGDLGGANTTSSIIAIELAV